MGPIRRSPPTSRNPRSTSKRPTVPPIRAGSWATLGGVTRPGTPALRGWFITFEGPEGAGKTTQVARAAAFLERHGIDVLVTREPGGTWLGERLREVLLARSGTGSSRDALTDAFLFNAARRQLVTEVIGPALAAGRTVLCARFADSTTAYQGYGAGVALDRLAALEVAATDGLRPDLTILLDVPPEVGLQRKAPGEVTRFEADFDLAFHQRVRDGFLAIATNEPGRFAVVDAVAAEEVVTAAIERVLLERVVRAGDTSEPPTGAVRITS